MFQVLNIDQQKNLFINIKFLNSHCKRHFSDFFFLLLLVALLLVIEALAAARNIASTPSRVFDEHSKQSKAPIRLAMLRPCSGLTMSSCFCLNFAVSSASLRKSFLRPLKWRIKLILCNEKIIFLFRILYSRVIPSFRPRFAGKCDRQSRDLT